MGYKQISKEERIKINTLLKVGCTVTQISSQLERAKSTVSREINRNKDPVSGVYSYSLANQQAVAKRKSANKKRAKITGEVAIIILENLKQDWSPQQITGRMRLKGSFPSHQTIYNYIYLYQRDWIKFLRITGIKGKYRRKYGTKIRERLREESKKNRIDTRPAIIENRSRIGDFEGDTIVGAEKTVHILTHVDRKSRFLIADIVQASAQSVHDTTLESLGRLPKNKLWSITYDNGVQFSKHENTEDKLKVPIYFAFPYHSWERGTNENTNGLLRKYYPKKSAFQDIKQEHLDKVVKLINTRPRKILNYLTPQEVFNGKDIETVALRT